MSTSFRMDMSRLNNIIRNGIENISKTGDLIHDIGEAFVSSAKMRFETETDPSGKKWVKGYKASGTTLFNRGFLRASIVNESNISEVIYGSKMEYARIHDKGGVIKAKHKKALRFQINGKWIVRKQVTIPKRQFIGISDDDAIEAREMIRLHITNSFLR